MKEKPLQYNFLAKGLHWISALIVLSLLPLGFYMVSLDFSPFKLDLYWWHKSFGTLVFFLVLVRMIWRFISTSPAHLESHASWERTLSKIIHFFLYVCMIGMPVSGILMSAAGDYPLPFFNLFALPDLIIGKDEGLFNRMRLTHEIFSYGLIACVGLHGLGAFKHHIIDKDITLIRMLPFKEESSAKKAGVFISALLFCVLMSSACLLGFNYFIAKLQRVDERAVRTEQVQNDAVIEEPQILGQSSVPGWEIIKEQSSIGFKAVAQGDELKGQFRDYDALINFDPNDLENSYARVSVKIESVSTGNEQKDGYIIMEPWLFAESFPESTLETQKIEKTDENQYVAHSILTMRGVALPVSVPFSLEISADESGKRHAKMLGSFNINRLDYKVGEGDWADPEMVQNALRISVSINAIEK